MRHAPCAGLPSPSICEARATKGAGRRSLRGRWNHSEWHQVGLQSTHKEHLHIAKYFFDGYCFAEITGGCGS